MTTYQNAKAKNEFIKTGMVAEYFEALKKTIQINDGKRDFIPKTRDCHDSQAPFQANQFTTLPITHPDHDVSAISEGFMSFKISVDLQLTGIDSTFNDPERLCKLFVGWKSSNQILDELQILSRNQSSNYQQNEMVREGFAYSNVKGRAERIRHRFSHSLYENVSYKNDSVCGTYINVQDFKDGLPHKVEIEAVLPFDDLLALQAFQLYPNRTCGDLDLKFKVTPIGLVWCMVDPTHIKEYKEILEGEEVHANISEALISGKFRHAFTQINNHADIINNYSVGDESTGYKVTASKGKCLLQCTGLRVTELKSNMFGFGVKESTLERIAEIFKNGVYIPSQQLDFCEMPNNPTATGIQGSTNIPLNEVTCISAMFPKWANDRTVFENPCLKGVYASIAGRNIPDEGLDTLGARFFQYQLVASDLHDNIECTKEFEDSLVQRKNDSDGRRYTNSLSDDTAFMFNIQLERNHAGYTFDGVDFGEKNVQVSIYGQPMITGEHDTYYIPDPSRPDSHPPPVQLWVCRDTYFKVSLDGLEYVRTGSPPELQAK